MRLLTVKMITTLIFDWGGVLTKGRHTKTIIRIIASKYNTPLDQTTTCANENMHIFNRNEIDFKEFNHIINQTLNLNISLKEMTEIFDQAIIPNDELIELLTILKKDYQLILLSNNNIPTIKILRAKHQQMLGLFGKTYFSAEFNTGKPDKEFFEMIIKDAKIKPAECVFIDDKEKNILAAKEQGFKGISFVNVERLKKELINLDVKL